VGARTRNRHGLTAVLDETSFDGRAREVAAAENVRCRALVAADVAALDAVSSADMIYIHSNGARDTRADFIGNVASGLWNFEAVEHDDVTVRVDGSLAVIEGAIKYHVVSGGNPVVIDAWFASIWTGVGGWKMESYHGTSRAK
jgi:hypothetical protein